MTKIRRKFELLIGDMRRLIEKPVAGEAVHDLPACAYGLHQFAEKVAVDPAKVRMLLEIATLLRASDVKRRQVTEEKILSFLVYLAILCQGAVAKTGVPIGEAFLHDRNPEVTDSGRVGVLRELHDFAVGCFSFKRARDAFGGKRRALAFEILSFVGQVADIPEAIVLALRALAKGRSAEACAAVEFIKDYHEAREMTPDESLVDEILRMTDRADSDSTVISGLNALMEMGVIGEFEAMGRLDHWREKHDGN
jgi:hypothetical protein